MKLSHILRVENISIPELDEVKADLYSLLEDIESNEKFVKTKENIISVFSNGEYEQEEIRKIQQVILLMLYLHIDQKDRPDGPYVQHTSGVMRKVSEGLKGGNVDVILAGGLHDSVEDQLIKVVRLFDLGEDDNIEIMRKKVIDLIGKLFGGSVSDIVAGVTNPLDDGSKYLTTEDFINKYTSHVMESTRANDKILLCKLSDFSENGLNLDSVKSNEQRLWFSRKYKNSYEYFISELEKGRLNHLKTKQYLDKLLHSLKSEKIKSEKFVIENNIYNRT